MVSRRGVGRGGRGGRARGRGCVGTICLSVSMSGMRSVTAMKDDRKRAI